MADKKYAIVCDDYKVALFIKKLTEAKLDFAHHPAGYLSPGHTQINVVADQSRFADVKTICEEVEKHYNNRQP